MLLCRRGLERKFVKFICYSLCVHAAIIVVVGLVSWRQEQVSQQTCVVLGLHSKDSYAFYKELPLLRPVVSCVQQAVAAPEVVSAPLPIPETPTLAASSIITKKPLQELSKPAAVPAAKKSSEPAFKKARVVIPEHIKQRVVSTGQDRNRQQLIAQEVSRLWQPPLGVPQGVTCRVSFTLDKKGHVTNVSFIERSAYLIYDLSIMQVAHQFAFHESLWGTVFTVDFTQ